MEIIRQTIRGGHVTEKISFSELVSSLLEEKKIQRCFEIMAFQRDACFIIEIIEVQSK